MKPKFKAGETVKYNGNVYRIDEVKWLSDTCYIYDVTCVVNNFEDEVLPYTSLGAAAEPRMELHSSDRRPPCPCCDKEKASKYPGIPVGDGDTATLYIKYDDCFSEDITPHFHLDCVGRHYLAYTKINYCPFCGRKLD